MATKLSLRVRLSFWFSAIVALSLSAFGAYTYISVSKQMHTNLDASLIKVASSLDYIITQNQENSEKSRRRHQHQSKDEDKFSIFRENEKSRFVGPLRPRTEESKNEENGGDPVWSAVYEHILLNPKNYYIQIADTNNQIIWRSRNLQQDSLPVLTDFENSNGKDTIALKSMRKDSVIKLTYDKDASVSLDSIFTDLKIQDQDVRLLVKRTQHAVVSVAYTSSDIQTSLNQLFVIQVFAFPIVLLIAIIGGLVLLKLSLRPIDKITKTADEITAKNLSRRLPAPVTNDEVGHLTNTLNQMIERLENSFIQIKKFTSDVSHELRTPLTILQGELEIALHSAKTQVEYENIIISALEEVARLTNVVETLLDLSRAETGQIQMNLAETDLSKLLLDISEDAEILAEMKEVTVQSKIENGIILPIDSPRIHQAVLNIVDNAIKYTPQGGSISISLTNGSNLAKIIVSDSGIGIPAEELPHIFDRMYRVDKSRSSNIQGHGLGLSIVKWIIEAHNGKIIVESQVNKGTFFTVELPKRQV